MTFIKPIVLSNSKGVPIAPLPSLPNPYGDSIFPPSPPPRGKIKIGGGFAPKGNHIVLAVPHDQEVESSILTKPPSIGEMFPDPIFDGSGEASVLVSDKGDGALQGPKLGLRGGFKASESMMQISPLIFARTVGSTLGSYILAGIGFSVGCAIFSSVIVPVTKKLMNQFSEEKD